MTSKVNQIRISVDVMGGDLGIKATIPAILSCAKKNPDIKFLCSAMPEKIGTKLDGIANIEIFPAETEITMKDSPVFAMRKKKNSSMSIAINLVKQGLASACVSSGNTGALMAISHFNLKMLPGISRPAIMSCMPTYQENKTVKVLDLGANAESSADNLYEFALAATATCKAEGILNPKIGLLNIGNESHKGPEKIKQANELLNKAKGINYCGYVEGNQIFSGEVDIIICDGFVGNIMLKSCEGVIGSIVKSIRYKCKQSKLTSLIVVLAAKAVKKVITKFHPDNHNGAILTGLNGIVVKSHGGANTNAFEAALNRAIYIAQGPNLKQELEKLMKLNQDIQ